MREVLSLSLQMALGLLLPWWIVRWDLKRLPPHQLERAWPDSSLLSAVVAFGPLCLPVHFLRTRRSLGGALLGAGALAVSLLVTSLAVAALPP